MRRAPGLSLMLPTACLALAGRQLGAADDIPVVWWAGWGAGYRTLDLDWKTSASAPGAAPVAPFEAVWRKLGALESDLSLTVARGPAHLRMMVGYGRVVSGGNHLSGYADDSRSVELYRSENRSDRGHLLEAAAAIGGDWSGIDGLRLSPELGYARSQQHLRISDGDQTIPASGPYAGLDSAYDASWQGPFANLTGSWFVSERIIVNAHAAYHLADFDGQADWNLRSDLRHPDSVTQTARGRGLAAGVGLTVMASDHLAVWMKCELEQWRAWSGTSTIDYADGTQQSTAFAEVRMRSRALMAGILWGF
jgi:hypothetical protein